MALIHVLDSETIDKIAAGEVVERPASVVKELVENAIDAGADAITVEIRDGGISFLRVTDNGCGMESEQVRTAFLRHATSKIAVADDLTRISSLGFRGEALSSIAAVAKVEIITKTRDKLTGTRMVLEGGKEADYSQVGAPDGTTFIVRNLFFNTPVRRNFLKTAATEGGYIAELMEHLALSRPDISFRFLVGNQEKFHTTGNGDLKEVIYRIYGREIAMSLIPISYEESGIRIDGYLGKPIVVRSNRNFEIYFMNHRFIRSNVIARAIEEGYKEYLMQHKFPFCVLHISMPAEWVDVNVHPTKMEVRFSEALEVCNILTAAVARTLKEQEMIPKAGIGQPEKEQVVTSNSKERAPEVFETQRSRNYQVMEEAVYRKDMETGMVIPTLKRPQTAKFLTEDPEDDEEAFFVQESELKEEVTLEQTKEALTEMVDVINPEDSVSVEEGQLSLFDEKILTRENRSRYRMIGQVFDTYWMLQFENELLIIDQHAAHEKVKYERLMEQYRRNDVQAQQLMPPIILTLTGREETVLNSHADTFKSLGFEVEAFGGNEHALRSVPMDLYGCSEKEMFLEVLDELASDSLRSIRSIEEKIASMSCKAAVKGNHAMSSREAEALIDELLTLENPYNCPHGRPTIISISKTEMEKKFKRIV